MEDLEMKHALRRYVETEEPPFSLTANALISQARRRQRWRVGLGIGGGGAATTLAIVSAFALVPVGGGPAPGAGCDVTLPLGPRITAPFPPAFPAPQPAFPSPAPTTPATGDPSPSGTWGRRRRPNPCRPNPCRPHPCRPNPCRPQRVFRRGNTPVPGDVSRERLDEMSCFLKRRLLQLRPDSTFVPHLDGPMEVMRESATVPGNRIAIGYRASAYVTDGPLLCLINVMVFRGDLGMTPGLSHADQMVTATVTTGTSTIMVTVEGRAIADGAAWAMANAPELDLYR